jgi:hypothetical protein
MFKIERVYLGPGESRVFRYDDGERTVHVVSGETQELVVGRAAILPVGGEQTVTAVTDVFCTVLRLPESLTGG